MNRVFLDPNTKYSDQYAMLAKMPDIVDEINEVADAVEDIPEIPAPAVADIGKVLGVVSDGESGAEYGAVAPASGLPAISAGDAGKVLTVNAGETGAEWASPSGGGASLWQVAQTIQALSTTVTTTEDPNEPGSYDGEVVWFPASYLEGSLLMASDLTITLNNQSLTIHQFDPMDDFYGIRITDDTVVMRLTSSADNQNVILHVDSSAEATTVSITATQFSLGTPTAEFVACFNAISG